MKTNFFRTVSIIYKNKFVNPYFATFRHVLWAFRKVFNIFPCDLKLGGLIVRVANLSVANGIGALVNAMEYYDPNNMLMLKEIFKTGLYNTFFDVGANVGVYSLLMAGQKKFVSGFAFEPHPKTFMLLQENVNINDLDNRVSCVQIALGESDGVVSFMNEAGNPENHIINGMGDGGLEVNIQRAEKICERENFHPQVLKIDVEGFENQVLAGFGILSLSKVQIVFIECWNLPETIRILCKQSGFKGPYKVDYKRRKLVNENIHDEDWVFINPRAVPVLCDDLKFEIPRD